MQNVKGLRTHRVDVSDAPGDRATTASPPPTRRAPESVAAGGRRARLATRAMQAGIAGCLVAGLAVGNAGVVVNAGLGLAATFLPAVLDRDAGVVLGPSLAAWIAAAVLLHAVGMLWLYTATAWWDHLTHVLSATLVASVGYAAARAVDAHSASISLPDGFLVVLVVLFTLALGVLWEVLEFGARGIAHFAGTEPLLRQHGLRDTMLDLLFDVVGALVAATYGIRHTDGLTARIVARLAERGAGGDTDAPER